MNRHDMITTIIVDDEPNCCEILSGMLAANCPDINVVSICSNGGDALVAIKDRPPD